MKKTFIASVIIISSAIFSSIAFNYPVKEIRRSEDKKGHQISKNISHEPKPSSKKKPTLKSKPHNPFYLEKQADDNIISHPVTAPIPVLKGILISETQKLALLEYNHKENFYQTKQKIDCYTVCSVNSNTVLLSKGAEIITLRLSKEVK